MADKKEDRRKFLKKSLGTATGVTLAGIAGVSLLKEESGRNQENPFEYNIDNFKTIDKSLLKYSEETPIKIEYKKYFSITIDKLVVELKTFF